jgi:hypothetical protein
MPMAAASRPSISPTPRSSIYPAFFPAAEADRLLRELRDTTAWRQDTITFFGKSVDAPRLTAWYGDEGTRYVDSGIENVPPPWTPALSEVKRAVEPPSGVVFNSSTTPLPHSTTNARR